MHETFIIDAYNAVRWVLPDGHGERGSESSRRSLEALLRSFRAASGPGTRIFLVYDGERGLPAPARREKGFEVYFSKPPRKADDVVLDLARKHEGEPGVTVVTSDFTDIGNHLRGMRLSHMSSQEFGDLVRKRTRQQPAPDRAADEVSKPEAVSKDEVAGWMREFGFEEGGPS